jgi:hypothetical protein
MNRTRRPVHGHASRIDGDSGTYRSWAAMVQRCLNKNTSNYKYYGGRGITVDPAWMVFKNFLADMGERPHGYSLDRVDNAIGYTKSNCRWVPLIENHKNKTRTHFLSFNGKTMSMTDWASTLNISLNTLVGRITNYGWSVEEALTIPVRRRK